jgi:uncharacterized protein
MRLGPREQTAIAEVFIDVFLHGKIYLFGSRLDAHKQGGDIDLYLELDDTNDLMRKKIDFLVKLKQKIGEQKIDLVVNRGEDRLIDSIAKKDGILICQN